MVIYMKYKELYDALPLSYYDGAPVCIIVGAGDMGHFTVAPDARDLVIAADGGYRYLKDAGVRCDLLMGDLDSLPADIPVSSEVRRFNPVKDDTDTMLAVRHGLSLGFRKFLFYGVFGGRFDHTVATLQTIAFVHTHGAVGYAFEETRDGRHASYLTGLYNASQDFSAAAKGYLSLFAWGGDAQGVTLENLKYTLTDDVLHPDIALGVSNEFIYGKAARVTVGNGLLLMVKPI